ncbi:DUF4817 domain-containing protein [Trichonephila clavipes]|nr:DUF4817 domain-containing protein [Trichonephila clavipes]
MSGDLGGHFNNALFIITANLTYPTLWEIFIQIPSHVIMEMRRPQTTEGTRYQNTFCGLVGTMLTILCSQERRIFQNLEYPVAFRPIFTTLYTLSTQKKFKKGTLFFGYGGTKSLSHRYLEIWWSCDVRSPRYLCVTKGAHIESLFVEWAENEIAVVPDFHKRILFSDEAHFWLNGYVNKQNCRIWSEANPQVYVETPLHPEKLTVWCALWAGGFIGPYFFKNDESPNELWFQQDGATCHTARATIDLLKDTFGDRLISRFGPVNWPPRSCDLTLLDYFLWGYVKSLVYADKPQTLDHLEDNIRRVIADIRPQMLEKVIEN